MTLLIYSSKESPRLRYIVKQLFTRMLGIPVNTTTKIEDFVAHNGPKFSYGKAPLGKELFFEATDLLFEKGIQDQNIKITDWKGLPCFFKVNKQESIIDHDIFAASFYLISRYEEYLPELSDDLGRYQAKNSIAYKNDFLQRPIVNEWLNELVKVISEKYPELKHTPNQYKLEFICEVNEAFAFKKKGWFRSIEGIAEDLYHLKFKRIIQRFKVLTGITKRDPNHTYNLIINKARKNDIRINIFFGLGKYSIHEKSTNANSTTYQRLIKNIGDYCPIGLRLSFDAQKEVDLFKNEKKRFEQITHRNADHVFCQYGKIDLPNTYRELVEQEVLTDYSMGYLDHAGFRAGTCSSFLFYDLDYEIQTPLKIVPFCVSKNAFTNIKSLDQAISICEPFFSKIKQVKGNALIHITNDLFNENYSRAPFWKGLYTYFLSKK